MLPTKFRSIWPSGFRGNDFLEIYFIPIRYQTWPPQTIIVSDWLISKKLSPMKPLGKMDQNVVGSILGRSFIKITHLVPIR
jgi:hypothetical protein